MRSLKSSAGRATYARKPENLRPPKSERPRGTWLWPILVVAAFLLGVSTSYGTLGRRVPAADSSIGGNPEIDMAGLVEQINPSSGHELPVRYGNLGPQLLDAGAIDYNAFVQVYKTSGDPLTQAQLEILTRGSNEPIVINAQNAHFLLNFFWAVGLVNQNPILSEGPINQYSQGQIEQFASTGGWTIGAKPVAELFSSVPLILLIPEQQARLEEAAQAVYRPCCDNPTYFPDCNHGMAMLGLLELMASQNASVDEMLKAATHVNAYWFPQQTLETAMYLKASQGSEFEAVDPRLIVGAQMSSASGFARVHQWLQNNGLLEKAPGSGNNCGT